MRKRVHVKVFQFPFGLVRLKWEKTGVKTLTSFLATSLIFYLQITIKYAS